MKFSTHNKHSVTFITNKQIMSQAEMSVPNVLDAARKELCRDIETMVQRLGCDYYTNELLHKQNADLKKEVRELLEDQGSMHLELERKNKQIAGFIETIESANQARAQQGQDIKEQFSFQANAVGMQYEVMCTEIPPILFFCVITHIR